MRSYTSQRVSEAILLAIKAHEGQLDKDEQTPYILHCFRVMLNVRPITENHLIVAVLHDVLEDTDITFEQLSGQFGFRVASRVRILTREVKESYTDYIERVSMDSMATQVKMADLSDNLLDWRLDRLCPADRDRLSMKYRRAFHVLSTSQGATQ